MTSSASRPYPRIVEGNKELLAIERAIRPPADRPAQPAADGDDQKLNVMVIFTSVEATLAALRTAGALASSLRARITLLALQVVPYPLPLESPPVLLDWSERRFQTVADQSPIETLVRLYLCRDRVETLMDVLKPRSVVVIGGRKSRWPFTPEKRLTRQLRRAGHEAVFTELE